MSRFSRPRLITFADPAYQRHVEQMQLQRANQRAIRPPAQRDLFGGEVEALLRDALSQQFALSDRRILEYEEQIGRAWQRKYRELDALVVDGQTRVHVFEIKASRRAGAVHRALRQLRDTQAILSLAFRSVSVAVLLVDTGIPTAAERDALLAESPDLERVPQTLDEALAACEQVRRVAAISELTAFPGAIEVAVLDVEQIVVLANGAPLSLDWDADESPVEADESPPAAPLYSTPDDDAESPFAAALRKAQHKK